METLAPLFLIESTPLVPLTNVLDVLFVMVAIMNRSFSKKKNLPDFALIIAQKIPPHIST